MAVIDDASTIAAECALACYGDAVPDGLYPYLSGAVNWIQFDVYESPEWIVVAFDGSNQGRDWWRHAHVKRCDLPYWMTTGVGKAHGGWLEDALRVFPMVSGCVASCRYRHPDARLLITGHSYGGALALSTAIPYAIAGKPVSLRTFGAPALLDRAGAAMADEVLADHVRFASGADAVTKVPILNHHCGRLVKVAHGWPAHSMAKYWDSVAILGKS